MRRLFLAATTVAVLLLTLLAPVALAAGPVTSTGSVVVSVNGTVDLPAGSNLDGVVVVKGNATIAGDVRGLVVVDGTATVSGATIRDLVVVDGSVDLVNGATVDDVSTWHAAVTRDATSTITGRNVTFETDLAALALVLVPLAIAFTVGMAIAAVVAALVVAAFASRQVRAAETEISTRPGHVLVAGILGSIGLPLLGGLLVLTVIGAPIGLALLLGVLPVAAFLGWIVAAIWIGEWLLGRTGSADTGRPYRAAVLGVIVLAVASLVPMVSTIATVFGLGALLMLAWRILRPEQPQPGAAPAGTYPGPVAPMPTAG